MTEAAAASSYHDVFLNFRGADTRIGFARNLFEALSRREIRTFFDDKGLKTGDPIDSTLVRTIRNSRMAITIFSPSYLESNACLMELAEISNNMLDGLIFPVFYDIEQEDLLDQAGVIKEEWKSALKKITQIRGRSFKTEGEVNEDQFIEEVAGEVSKMFAPSYDVFLNFRCGNPRNGFPNNLCKALRRRGIQTFFNDKRLETTQDVINRTVVEAIQNSKMAITIFCPRYLESNACLVELTEICNNKSDGSIFPIFYDIEPSELRNKSKEMEQERSSAVDRVTRMKSPLIFRSDGPVVYETDFITQIVNDVSKKLDQPSNTVDDRTGLKSRVQAVRSKLDLQSNDGINMVAICGMAGIGKTTIARAVYDSLCSEFEHDYFLSNVREKSMKDGLESLQQELLSEIFEERKKKHPEKALKKSLKAQKVLLVLDDVSDYQQIEKLASRDWFHRGSKIIMTTKNQQLLRHDDIEKYEVPELREEQARQLFILRAFKKKERADARHDLINRAIKCARRHPLVLEALGSKLSDLPDEMWEAELTNYECIPTQLKLSEKEIQDFLRVSYDGLERAQKEIFLDIACFYNNYMLDYVKYMLESSHGLKPEPCIQVLIDKFLIKINQKGCLDMHDLYEEMGKEIVRQLSKSGLGAQSRLWLAEDILRVLEHDMGTGEIQVIKLIEFGDKKSGDKKIEWSGEAFRKMHNLRELCVKGNIVFSTEPKFLPNSLRVLEWHQYPSSSLPSGFKPDNLVILNLHDSHIELEKPLKRFSSMRELILDRCQYLTQVPDLSGAPMLENMNLNHCRSLIKIDNSVGSDLPKLRKLTARGCRRLKIFPRVLKLPSLEILEIVECWDLQNFPEILETMENVKSVCLSHSGIVKIPESIENLIGLECLYLNGCKRLREVPMGSIAKLRKLQRLIAGLLDYGQVGCCEGQEEKCNDPKLWTHVDRLKLDHSNFIDGSLPRILSWFPNLQELDLSFSNFEVLPACLKECHCLEKLDLTGCYPLQEIEGIPQSIKRFSAENTSLSLNSSSLLLSQKLHMVGNTNFILPGNQIPNWFPYVCKSRSWRFRLRKKLPDIIACVVLRVVFDRVMPQQFGFDFEVSINGARRVLLKEEPGYRNFIHFELMRDHVYLVDLTSRIQKLEFHLENSQREWNLIELSCPTNSWFSFNSSNHGEKADMGVYVNNLESYAQVIAAGDLSLSNVPDVSKNSVPYSVDESASFSDRVIDSFICDYSKMFGWFWEMDCKDLWDRYISNMWDKLDTEEDSNSNATASQHPDFRREGRTWYQSITIRPYEFWHTRGGIPKIVESLSMDKSLNYSSKFRKSQLLTFTTKKANQDKDSQQEQWLLASLNQKISEGNESDRKSKGKDIIVHNDNVGGTKVDNPLEEQHVDLDLRLSNSSTDCGFDLNEFPDEDSDKDFEGYPSIRTGRLNEDIDPGQETYKKRKKLIVEESEKEEESSKFSASPPRKRSKTKVQHLDGFDKVEEGGATGHKKKAQHQPAVPAIHQQASNSPQADEIEGLSARITKLESGMVKLESGMVKLKQQMHDEHRMVMDRFSHLVKLLSGSASSSQPPNH